MKAKKQNYTFKTAHTFRDKHTYNDERWNPSTGWTDSYTLKLTELEARTHALMLLGGIVNTTWKEGHTLISAYVDMTNSAGELTTFQFHSTPNKEA